MSCVLRRNPPKVRRNPRRTDPLLVFAAVKKTAPSPRGATVRKFPMHAYSLLSPGVGWCATNEVVQFFVCCGTFVLSVGLLFFNAELVFLRPCLFHSLVRNFSLLLLFRRFKFQNHEFWRACGYPYVCVWVPGVCGRLGVWVTGTRLFVRRVASVLPVLDVSSPQLDDKHRGYTRSSGPSARAQWRHHHGSSWHVSFQYGTRHAVQET